jgi:hypothetical protein
LDSDLRGGGMKKNGQWNLGIEAKAMLL